MLQLVLIWSHTDAHILLYNYPMQLRIHWSIKDCKLFIAWIYKAVIVFALRNIFCCCQLYAVFGFPHSLLLLKRSNLSVSHVMSHVVECSNVLQSSVFRTHKRILRTFLANICCMNWLSVTSFTYVWGTCLVYFYRSPIWGFSEQAKPTVQKQLIQ